MPGLQLYHEVYVNDKIVIPKVVSKSIVNALIYQIYRTGSNVAVSTFNINNVYTAMSFLGYGGYCMGIGGGNSYLQNYNCVGDYIGIVVGLSTSAVAMTDYALQSRIPHGSGTNQLEYFGDLWQKGVTVAGSDASFWVDRIFRNSSGATVTVNEIGLYYQQTFMYARDVLASPVPVNDGEYLKVRYTFTVTA